MYNKFNRCIQLTKDNKYIHVENNASYYITRHIDKYPDGDKLYIFFEKSNSKVDWRNNFDFPAKPYRKMKNLWFCHRGFLKVWKSIEPYIANDILDPAVKEIEIVGYSHGGAIAQLCYEYVKFNRPDVEVSGYGFGSPRVLWGFARRVVRDRFKGFKVVRNGKDLVTHMPPVLLGFTHVSEVVEVGTPVDNIGVKDHYADRYLEALLRCQLTHATTK